MELAEIPDFTEIVANSKIRDAFLHKVPGVGKNNEVEFGSLNNKVAQDYRGKYDIVISDPPWQSVMRSKDWKVLQAQIQNFAKLRYSRDTKKILPFQSADLAFIWRAMEWAKPKGQVAMVANAKLLVGQEQGMAVAREILFSSLDLKYIINGTQLRGTSVWFNNPEPFCMIQGVNRAAPHNLVTQLITPQFESGLNASGLFRIAHESPNLISPAIFPRNPAFIKVISTGSLDDYGILSRMHDEFTDPLANLYQRVANTTGLPVNEHSGVGYTNGYYDAKNQTHSKALVNAGLSSAPDLINQNLENLLISAKDLGTLDTTKISSLPKTGIFKGPVLIVNQFLAPNKNRIQVAMSNNDLLFDSSYIGYSAHDYPNGETLIKYLCIVLRSQIAIWQLLVSGEFFAVNSVAVKKSDLDKILIPNFDTLSEAKLTEVSELFDDICEGCKSDHDLDEWVTDLYQISDFSHQTIYDTVANQFPIEKNTIASQKVPIASEIRQFCTTLESKLGIFRKTKSSGLKVKPVSELSTNPFTCVYISAEDHDIQKSLPVEEIKSKYLQTINSSSEPVLLLEYQGGIIVAILTQNRNFNSKVAKNLASRVSQTQINSLRSLNLE